MAATETSQQGSLDGVNAPAPWQKAAPTVFGSRTAQEHAIHLLPHVKADSRILDVGCGVGSITIGFAELASKGSVVGIDTDQSALDNAFNLAKQKAVTNIDFSIGNAYDLSRFPADSFDIVHSHMVVLHLKDPIKALIEMRRVLKPGGVLNVRDSVDMHFIPKDPIIEKYMAWYQDFRQKSGTVPQAGLHHHVWVHEAGFPWEKISVSTASHGYSGPEARRTMVEGTKNAFRSIGVSMGYGTEAEFDEIEEHWMEWSRKEEGRMLGLDSVVLAWK